MASSKRTLKKGDIDIKKLEEMSEEERWQILSELSDKDFDRELKKLFGQEFKTTKEMQDPKFSKTEYKLQTLNAKASKEKPDVIYSREINELFKIKFRQKAHLPEDLFQQLDKLKVKLIKDREIEISQINNLFNALDNALQDMSQKNAIINLIDRFIKDNNFPALITELKIPGNLSERGTKFFEKHRATIAKLTKDFTGKMQKKICSDVKKSDSRGEWNKMLEDIGKSIHPSLPQFTDMILANVFQSWETEVNEIVKSSQNYSNNLFGATDKAKEQFELTNKRYEHLIGLMQQLLLQLKSTPIVDLYLKIAIAFEDKKDSGGLPHLYESISKTAKQHAQILAARQQTEVDNTAIDNVSPKSPGKSSP